MTVGNHANDDDDAVDRDEPSSIGNVWRNAQPFRLEVRNPSPRLRFVTWVGSRRASADEAERIAQLVVSRGSGAMVVVGLPGMHALPERLAPLVAETPAVELVPGDPRLLLHAPAGRGRVLVLRDASEAAVDALAAKLARAGEIDRLEREIELRLAGIAERARREEPADADAALDVRELRPADRRDEAAFEHRAESGERVVARAAAGEPTPAGAAAGSAIRVGRLVRGGESFVLAPRRGGQPLERGTLVLLRSTLAQDRGALLRVELDDEDLGPWRLGDRGAAGSDSLDPFWIASDLIAGRERFRLSFTPTEPRDLVSWRWWFGVEEEIDGAWLTDLEPARFDASAAAPSDLRGWSYAPGSGRFQRTLSLGSGARAEFEIPPGYSSFRADARLRHGMEPPRALTLRVELDGERRLEAALDVVAAPIEVALRGARCLTLVVEPAGAPTGIALDRPALLR